MAQGSDAFPGTARHSESQAQPSARGRPRPLTLDHDHVDVDGAYGRLREALSLLQHGRDLARRDSVIGLGPECHQLPNGDA